MGVAGAPERTKNHAELIMDMALDMRDVVQFVKDPRPGSDGHIKIRLGSHSGQVCLFVISVCVVFVTTCDSRCFQLKDKGLASMRIYIIHNMS